MSFFLSFFFFLLGGRERYFFKWGWHLNWDYKISHLHMRCRKTSTHRKFVQVMEIEISRFFVLFCFVFGKWLSWVQFSSVAQSCPTHRDPMNRSTPELPAAAAAAKSPQSCPTLHDPRDCSQPGFPVPGILLARTLERVAISFSNAWKWKVKSLSHVQL